MKPLEFKMSPVVCVTAMYLTRKTAADDTLCAGNFHLSSITSTLSKCIIPPQPSNAQDSNGSSPACCKPCQNAFTCPGSLESSGPQVHLFKQVRRSTKVDEEVGVWATSGANHHLLEGPLRAIELASRVPSSRLRPIWRSR